MRVAAAVALGRLPGEHEGADALAFALADEEPRVRAAACRALGQLAPPQATSALLSATNDRAQQVRAAAVAALVALDNPVALARLRAIVAEDPAPAVVVHAIAGHRSLGARSGPHDADEPEPLRRSRGGEGRRARARGLRRRTARPRRCSGWSDTRAGTCAGRRRRRSGAAAIAPRSVPLSRALEHERDPLVRQAVSDAMAQIDGILDPGADRLADERAPQRAARERRT